ncbi:MAG: DNA recombination protein RmuC [Candidatus Nealsonbacteria bacterium]|nr:DNA recombination protein RmuC [Candidatus Nealsonbacteria bacterium]
MSVFYSILIVAGLVLGVTLLVILLIRNLRTDRQQSEAILSLERRLTDLMIGQMKDIRSSVDGTSQTLHEQIRSFTREATQIREDLKQVQEKVQDVSSFQEIFRVPNLRGPWGEASLQHILGQHFPAELCRTQYLFSSGERVDAVLKLPNGKVLPIDSKFPLENFEKMVQAATNEEKESWRAIFLEDVKKQILDISQKYISPAEGTTDFALLYIPAEAVYYEIINGANQKTDIVAFAETRKVILCSPNTIYLTLRTIEHWFKDTQISRQTQEILKRLGRVQQDAVKLMEEFRKLGNHLKNASSAYSDSEKRLNLFGEKVEKLIETGETKKDELGEG